jgi:hypothetical protein
VGPETDGKEKLTNLVPKPNQVQSVGCEGDLTEASGSAKEDQYQGKAHDTKHGVGDKEMKVRCSIGGRRCETGGNRVRVRVRGKPAMVKNRHFINNLVCRETYN